MFRSLLHYDLIFIYGVRQGSKYLVILTPFVEKIILSPIELIWHPCQKSIGYRCVGLFLDFQFYSIGLYVYLFANTTLFTTIVCSKF